MWNLLFELLILLLVMVCFHKLAKSYGDKFKSALRSLKHLREGDYGFTADLMEFKMYRAASILFELASYICLWKSIKVISTLIS